MNTLENGFKVYGLWILLHQDGPFSIIEKVVKFVPVKLINCPYCLGLWLAILSPYIPSLLAVYGLFIYMVESKDAIEGIVNAMERGK